MTGYARTVFVEGLPGSGKTSLAQTVALECARAGEEARWWPEIAAEHPATPKRLRRTAARPGFAERCVEHWIAFSADRVHGREVTVLEGSVFQSTIRYMLEQDVPAGEILAYVREFDRAVAPLAPCLVYLHAPDPRGALTRFVYPTRGEHWVSKVSGYLSTTPCCVARSWSGVDGMTEFWLLYLGLCEQALAELTMPVLRVETGPRRWNAAQARALDWLGGRATDAGTRA